MSFRFLIVCCLFWSTIVSSQSIFRTACNGNLTRLDSILVNKDVDISDHRGMGLLHWAVACKQKEVFDYLVDKGIDINQKNNLGATPMHIAVGFNRPYFYDRLSKLQADNWIKTLGPDLFTPAILRKRFDFINRLVADGIDINSVNTRGSTPLEMARRMKADSLARKLIILGADTTKIRTVTAFGPYMNQVRPDSIPQIFAPNFISTEEYEFGAVFNQKGNEFYYGVDVIGRNEIRYTKLKDGQWTEPEVLLAHERYSYNDPFLSPDEQRLYFISRMPLDKKGGNKRDHDIWFIQKEGNAWSDPINAGAAINSEGSEYYISFTKDGTMYFATDKATLNSSNTHHDIYYSKMMNGEFQEAVPLGSAVNTPDYEADVFVDPDEQYLIFCAIRDEGFGRGDLYISFKNEKGAWTEAQNLGQAVNTEGHELCPFVTADGKYLIYTSKEDIYWVSTSLFDKFKSKNN